MAFIELNDIRLRYRLDGPEDAPVLVLSNSLGTTLEMWDPQVPEFARRFRVLRLDTRGHGESGAPEGDYHIGQLGRDVTGLMDALGIRRAHYCGLSMGGLTGIWLGVHAGERFDRLVLCNTAARIGSRDNWDARMATIREQGMDRIAAAAPERWFSESFRARAAADVGRVQEQLRRTPPQGYSGCCAAIRDADLRADLGRITAPVLVIAGSHDVATPPADGRALAAGIGGARYRELQAGHLSNIEAAGAFTQTVLDFLGPHEGGRHG
ncbi:MAG TPA: 3-oxoadipate enol-lactonase [Gammaproteobacteria bacterium]|nr:3-oxoadipate enol-lactonase [Gammaproteobacteria bacterium]